MTALLDLTGGKLDVNVNPGDTEAFVVPLPVDLTGAGWSWTAETVTVVVAADHLVVTVPASVTGGISYGMPKPYAIYVTSSAGARTTMLSGSIFVGTTGTATVSVRLPNPTGPDTVVVNVSVTVGVPGPPGPAGGGGSGASVFTQPTPAATWTISHSLGRLAQVVVYGLDGHPIIPDVFSDASTVVLTFGIPTAGKALIS